MRLVACSKQECPAYKSTRYTHTFCALCGSELQPVAQCCEKVTVDETPFCCYCGKKKEVQFELPLTPSGRTGDIEVDA
jgi:hypothetical protein